MRLLTAALALLTVGCTGIPKGVRPVKPFELKSYLGTWYEIARFDHSFERGLTKVTANYTLRDDGGVNVLNKGYSAEKKSWKQARGKAYFAGNNEAGHLKVSFFGPFYGSYVIFHLDDYEHALVCGPNRSYLWILSRSPTITDEKTRQLVAKAKEAGFDTRKLIFVDQDRQGEKGSQ